MGDDAEPGRVRHVLFRLTIAVRIAQFFEGQGRTGRVAIAVPIGLILIGAAMRVAFYPAHTIDIDTANIPWLKIAEVRSGGYLRHAFTDYTPFYDHCLALLALFPGPEMLRIKGFSILFDVVLAVTVAALVGRRRAPLAFALTLAMPSIALNSAFMAQSDAIYAVFSMLSLLACDRRKPVWAMLAFSVAVAVKLQALLFAPVLVLLFLERRQPLWTFLLAPLAYIAFALPMLVAGRPIAEIGGVYGSQFNLFSALSANAPNAWFVVQIFVGYHWGLMFGLPIAVILVTIAVLIVWQRGILQVKDGLLVAAAILLIVAPFVTPKMHDRYFYLVDPVMIALYCRDRRYLWPMLLAELASLLAYLPFMADAYLMHDPVWGRGGTVFGLTGLDYRAIPVLGAVAMGGAFLLLLRRADPADAAMPMDVPRLGDLIRARLRPLNA